MSERIPILRIGRFLLVSIQVELDDRLALRLQDDLSQAISRHSARGVLIDVSSLEIIDSFIGRVLGNMATTSRILGAVTVLVGMRPAVAITLVEMGVRLDNIRTALDVDRGLELLREETDGILPGTHFQGSGGGSGAGREEGGRDRGGSRR